MFQLLQNNLCDSADEYVIVKNQNWGLYTIYKSHYKPNDLVYNSERHQSPHCILENLLYF